MTRGTLQIRCEGVSDVGLRREVNEDALLVAPEIGVLAVADGMGGHTAGEIASGLVIDTLKDFLAGVMRSQRNTVVGPPGPRSDPQADSLRAAIELANDRIFETIDVQPELRGMGTTVVAALIQGDQLTIGSVGDSRAYLLRNGKLRQLTTDHSWVQEQVDLGLLSPAEAHRHPFRNIVTRALGSREDVSVDIREERLAPGDSLLLCSDGLNSMVSDQAIESILKKAGADASAACQELVGAANQAGGEDNVTVIVASAEPDPA